MSSNVDLFARRQSAVARGVGHSTPLFAARASNAEIWDVEGKRYIDFAGGIAVLNTGHCHPRIIEAVTKQLSLFTHTCFQVMPYASYIELAERLNALAPLNGPTKTVLFSTGAEATENAVKIARAATGRPGIIAFTGGFHGRTIMASAMTGKVSPYKKGLGPALADVWHVPFPTVDNGVEVSDSLRYLDFLFKADIDVSRIAAIIIEPVQGEGGFHQAPLELMRSLRRLCDEHGIVLIADEVQTGFGRTGKMFAMEHYDERADLMCIAKSLAGGFPLSGVIGRAAIMEAAEPGGLGGTYAGNPLALAAAHAVIDVIDEEKLLDRANVLGAKLVKKLEALRSSVPQIADVRGLGAMIAVEFNKPGTREPDADFAKKVQGKALEGGLVLLTCGVYANALRFLFPLTIQDRTFEEGIEMLEAAMTAGESNHMPRSR